MLIYAVYSFAAAALGGVALAASVLRGKLAPWALSLAHAGLGALGLGLMLYAVLMQGASGHALTALIILGAAALGGFFLASFHVRKALPPKAVVVIHALAAVAGVALLAGLVYGLI